MRRHYTKPFCPSHDAFNFNCSLLIFSPIDGQSLISLAIIWWIFFPVFPIVCSGRFSRLFAEIYGPSIATLPVCPRRLFLDVLTGQDEPLPFVNHKPPNEPWNGMNHER